MISLLIFIVIGFPQEAQGEPIRSNSCYIINQTAGRRFVTLKSREPLPEGTYRVVPTNISASKDEITFEIHRFDSTSRSYDVHSYFLAESALKLANKTVCPKDETSASNDNARLLIARLKANGVMIGSTFPKSCPEEFGEDSNMPSAMACMNVPGLMRSISCASSTLKLSFCDRGSGLIAQWQVVFLENKSCVRTEKYEEVQRSLQPDGSILEVSCSGVEARSGFSSVPADGPIRAVDFAVYELMLKTKNQGLPQTPKSPKDFVAKWRLLYKKFEADSPRYAQMGPITKRIYEKQKENFLNEKLLEDAASKFTVPKKLIK